jgi:hypothetical protein
VGALVIVAVGGWELYVLSRARTRGFFGGTAPRPSPS